MNNEKIMLDLETMGQRKDAAIIAIGAVKFGDGKIYDEFYQIIDLQSSIDAGLSIDASTIMWWMKQSDAARNEFGRASASIDGVLQNFSDWIGDDSDPEIWGNGAAFDNVILANAYHKCGIKQPWKYWNDRCYRTIKAMVPKLTLERTGTHHNALDDAKHQALHLMKIFGQID